MKGKAAGHAKLGFQEMADGVYEKRRLGQSLSYGDLMVMLADTILDQRFFKARAWNLRYGGLRYVPQNPASDPIRKILVMQWPAAIGDTAMACRFYTALRSRYPGARIDVLGNETVRSIYKSSGLIDQFVDNPLNDFLLRRLEPDGPTLKALITAILHLTTALSSEQYDLLFNLQILPMSAVLAKLAGARRYIGMSLSEDGMPLTQGNIWAPYLFGVSANLFRQGNHTHRVAILEALVEPPQENLAEISPRPSSLFSPLTSVSEYVGRFLNLNSITDRDVVVGFCPLASSSVKTWPYFDKLIEMVSQKYGAKLLVFGDATQAIPITEIIRRSGVDAIACTHFDLDELMSLIGHCDLFVSSDTGPMHLACLMKRKTIALFGPTSVVEVGPWSTQFVALQSKECKACFKLQCDRKPSCMELITSDDAMLAVDFFLAGDKLAKTRTRPQLHWWSQEDSFQSSSDRGSFVCAQIAAKVRNALDMLNRGAPVEEIEAANADISKNCGAFKSIIVLNDFRFLDKRLSVVQDQDAYRRYFLAILEEMDQILHVANSFEQCLSCP